MGGWTVGVVVILAAVVRTQFDTDAEERACPHQADFEPPGASAATPETEMSGTWAGVLPPLGQGCGPGTPR